MEKRTKMIITGRTFISYTSRLASQLMDRNIMPSYSMDLKKADGHFKPVFCYEIDEYLIKALSEIFECEVEHKDRYEKKQ